MKWWKVYIASKPKSIPCQKICLRKPVKGQCQYEEIIMRQLLIAFSVVLAAPAWAETRDPANHFFQPKFGDLQADLQEAKKQGKKGIFLFFEMDDCPFCERMKTTILNQSEVQDAYRAQFLLYSIDVNGDTQMTDFQGKNAPKKTLPSPIACAPRRRCCSSTSTANWSRVIPAPPRTRPSSCCSASMWPKVPTRPSLSPNTSKANEARRMDRAAGMRAVHRRDGGTADAGRGAGRGGRRPS